MERWRCSINNWTITNEKHAGIDSISLEDKVASIRAKENYTTFDQLPEIYVDAVLSVEDHRFYNHPGNSAAFCVPPENKKS